MEDDKKHKMVKHSGKVSPHHHRHHHHKKDVTSSEVARKSLLDLLKENFSLFSRINYVHRLIYVVEHNFETESDASDILKTTIDRVNKEYCEEKLTGVVIYYRTQFCHMLEGSEAALMKHLCIIKDKSLSKHFKRAKILIFVNNISDRFFKDWEWYMGQPSVLVEDIDPQSDVENSVRYVNNAIDRIHKFASVFSKNIYKTDEEEEGSSSEDNQEVNKPIKTTASYTTSAYREFLPENKLVDFLLGSRFLGHLSQFPCPNEDIQRQKEHDSKLWPVPADYVPYNVFDKPYIPMEAGIIKTEETEEFQVTETDSKTKSIAEAESKQSI